jgi:prevent-host-death family protein
MSAVSVRHLKENLSEHLLRVQAGQRIVVTDRGRPIAEITPLRPEHAGGAARADGGGGLITLPRGKKKRSSRLRPVSVRGRPVAETLLKDRR